MGRMKEADGKRHAPNNPDTHKVLERGCGTGKREGVADGPRLLQGDRRVLELVALARSHERMETHFILYFTLVNFTFYKLYLSEKCPQK